MKTFDLNELIVQKQQHRMYGYFNNYFYSMEAWKQNKCSKKELRQIWVVTITEKPLIIYN